MAAGIIKVDVAHPEKAFSRCRDVIRSGGVIAYPTETFYALGADPGNPAAVKRLFEIKGRAADQPILILVKDSLEVKQWASEITPAAELIMNKYWPGPLTLVFNAKPGLVPELTAGTNKIGLRVPGNILTLKLLEFLDTALTGTSANISGQQSPQTVQEVIEGIGDMVALILDGGKTTGGKPSTIMDVSEDHPKALREGAMDVNEIIAYIRMTS